MSRRAIRRHRRLVRKKRMLDRQKFRQTILWFPPNELTATKHIDTPTPCSCQMCRNPRRSNYCKGKDKLTMQERRAEEFDDDYKYEDD